MRGIVEIYSGDKLVHKGDNLIVDGASELLADIMTVSPSLSGMEHSTSSLLDTSNSMVQAISFGKGSKAYQTNAHFKSNNKALAILTNSTTSSLIITYEEYPTLDISSYIPFKDLPTAPTPLDTKLELTSDLSAFPNNLSAIMPGNGHNLNMVPEGYYSSILSSISGWDSIGSVGGSILGCYPDGSAVKGTNYYIFSSLGNLGVSIPEPASKTFLSGVYEGLFNSVSSMDTSGFVNMVASSWVDERYSDSHGSNWYDPSYSGLIVSAYDGFSSVSGGGEVQYIVTVSGSDLGGANLYGGIYNMGLWTIDVDKTLKAGNTAPFSFSPIYNPRKYKLFAKKSFSKNLCYIEDDTVSHPDSAGIYGYNDLRIVWRIRFL